ncbi:MAG: hypothetical protein LBV16_04860 [Elusimicrobiota bacterium]|jgi:hypothetical protein|nr:hypothetical protein [Elusimicrobiota bacterium]
MKRELGQYYTVGNPFSLKPFARWAQKANLINEIVLEPFAGANNIISLLQDLGFAKKFRSYDIEPNNKRILYRDSLKDFPKGHKVCITNPPWLAKNSATRRGLSFPNPDYDDIYKFALAKCLDNCDFVAAIIPESFIKAGIFHNRLFCVISLAYEMFNDTDAPACLALFMPKQTADFEIYRNNKRLGTYYRMQEFIPQKQNNYSVQFNRQDGNLGLYAIDDTSSASIRFCDVDELSDYKVRQTCRSITKIKIDKNLKIYRLNEILNDFRNMTQDIFLTAFKGLRKDGMYRRRLDWDLARRIVNAVK